MFRVLNETSSDIDNTISLAHTQQQPAIQSSQSDPHTSHTNSHQHHSLALPLTADHNNPDSRPKASGTGPFSGEDSLMNKDWGSR
jgi:hypothetical protein